MMIDNRTHYEISTKKRTPHMMLYIKSVYSYTWINNEGDDTAFVAKLIDQLSMIMVKPMRRYN